MITMRAGSGIPTPVRAELVEAPSFFGVKRRKALRQAQGERLLGAVALALVAIIAAPAAAQTIAITNGRVVVDFLGK